MHIIIRYYPSGGHAMDRQKVNLLINIAYYAVIGLGVFLLLRWFLPAILPFAAAYLISYWIQRTFPAALR